MKALRREEKPGAIRARVYSSMPAGSETLVQLSLGAGAGVLAKEIGLHHYDSDEEVWLDIDPEKVNVFDKKTGRLIKLAALEF